MHTVNDLEKWNYYFDKFRANGWELFQMQYNWDDKEGFHAWFIKGNAKDIEIVTYNEEVQKAIVEYKK